MCVRAAIPLFIRTRACVCEARQESAQCAEPLSFSTARFAPRLLLPQNMRERRRRQAKIAIGRERLGSFFASFGRFKILSA